MLRPTRLLLLAVAVLAASPACTGAPVKLSLPPATIDDPIIVVGGGLAGLSAAAEAASAGARVVLIDRWSVFGGHAVVSGGGITMVGTPVQQAAGITDTPALAAEDFAAWGGDVNQTWVQRYATESRSQVHDWLAAMGVEFSGLAQLQGSRVARYHRTRDGGVGLVTPVFRNAIELGVEIRSNEEVTELVVEDGRVIGVRSYGVRDGRERARRARAVILATGGFQSNLERVRMHWPSELPTPQRILAGSGVNSQGDGLDLAREAGAALHRLDHQWNYPTGLPDPRFPRTQRGLNVEVPQSIWLNSAGNRFVDERAGTRVTFPAVMRQPGTSFFAIMDADGVRAIAVSGPEWADRARVQRDILDNEKLVVQAGDLPALARAAGIPTVNLEAAVAAHNLGAGSFHIARPPFYAMQLFPLARKSMGGVAVDENAQVLRRNGAPIEGLYAAGEVTGFAGINGRAALEGTFLGPAVLMGRIAGRAAARQALRRGSRGEVRRVEVAPRAGSFANEACTSCHPLQALELPRPGWEHLAAAHGRVRAENGRCASCHSEMYPYRDDAHRADPLLQSATCRGCHLPR